MKMSKKFSSLLLILTSFSLMMLTAMSVSATGASEEVPGRAMARQATKSKAGWSTADHAKHTALQKDFTSGKEVTQACLSCHSEAESQFHKSIHWTWLTDPEDKDRQYGKLGNSLNNFCISTNKGVDASCLSCHPGWGTNMEEGVNCLVCHSQKKMNFDETMEDIQAFLGEGDEESLEIARELQGELKKAAQDISLPGRNNCGSCHFYGGGGDGVKHGDLDSSLEKPQKTLDVHMGTDSQNFTCTRCHTTELHNIAGRVYTSPAAEHRKSLIDDDQTSKITCESCHTNKPHRSASKANDHTDVVACQTCHIPEFARERPTKMSWDWSQAGRKKDGKNFKSKDEYGQYDYMTIKGQMRWEKNVTPEYYWYNGAIHSVTAKDVIDPSKTVRVSWPEGSRQDKNARIYPFKTHRGKQPYDKINKTLLVPLLSGKDGYWETLDWDRALKKGHEAAGIPFSGEFDFVESTYVFPITHMVAPKENVVACSECHTRENSRLSELKDFYMPGRGFLQGFNSFGWILVIGSLAGVFLHGLGRLFTNGKTGKK